MLLWQACFFIFFFYCWEPLQAKVHMHVVSKNSTADVRPAHMLNPEDFHCHVI